MSFAIWPQRPPFIFAPGDQEQVYQVGAVWVVTDDPTRATQAAVDAAQTAQATETQRASDIDGAINAATFGGQTIASLKTMTRDQFNTWWAANVTTAGQAITVLKWIAWLVLRRI